MAEHDLEYGNFKRPPASADSEVKLTLWGLYGLLTVGMTILGAFILPILFYGVMSVGRTRRMNAVEAQEYYNFLGWGLIVSAIIGAAIGATATIVTLVRNHREEQESKRMRQQYESERKYS